MENCRFALYINMLFLNPFLLKFLGKLCAQEREKQLCHHFHGVYTLIEYGQKGNNVCRFNVYLLVAVKNQFVACM